MTLTRWKLMAGVLGLSLCGLAALAEPACRTVGYAQRKPDDKPQPVPDAGAKPLPPPVAVEPPKPLPLPSPAPTVLPKADTPPASTEVPPPLPLPLPKSDVVSSPDAVKPLPLPEPKAVSGGLDEKAFTEMAKQSLKLPDLPKLDGKKEEAKPTVPVSDPPKLNHMGETPSAGTPGYNFNTGQPKPGTEVRTQAMPGQKFQQYEVTVNPVKKPLLGEPAKPEVAPLPVPGGKAAGYKLDDGTVLRTPEPKPADPILPTPPSIPVPVKAEVPSAPPSPSLPAPPQLTPRAVETVATKEVTATIPAERKLKVQLHLGGGKPWFEVHDGEELVLKVVSDAVEVKAPAENGDAASLLRASGGVTFRTLGGNGTCDELRVVPGTGEVVASGRVAVTSNWGKAETTATAEKMTFRLGGEVGGKK